MIVDAKFPAILPICLNRVSDAFFTEEYEHVYQYLLFEKLFYTIISMVIFRIVHCSIVLKPYSCHV